MCAPPGFLLCYATRTGGLCGPISTRLSSRLPPLFQSFLGWRMEGWVVLASVVRYGSGASRSRNLESLSPLACGMRSTGKRLAVGAPILAVMMMMLLLLLLLCRLCAFRAVLCPACAGSQARQGLFLGPTTPRPLWEKGVLPPPSKGTIPDRGHVPCGPLRQAAIMHGYRVPVSPADPSCWCRSRTVPARRADPFT